MANNETNQLFLPDTDSEEKQLRSKSKCQCWMAVSVCVYICVCLPRTGQPEVSYTTFELTAKSGQIRSEWMSHERRRQKQRSKKKNVWWNVIHLVGKCDVNSTDGATLHMLLPINLLKWITNTNLGASTGLQLLSRTHTETKHTIFISSFAL